MNPTRPDSHPHPAGRLARLGRAVLLVLAFLAAAAAETPSIAALRAELGPLRGKERLAALHQLVNRIEGQTPQEALVLAAEGLELARREGDQVLEATFLSSSAYCYSQTGDFAMALKCGRESLELSQRIGHRERIATAHNTLGIAYTFMGAYSQALEEHLESLRLREEYSLDEAAIKSLNNIGILYHNIGQYEKAKFYYQKIMERLKFDQSKSVVVLAKLNTGFADYKLGNLEQALKNHEEALELILRNKHQSLLAYAYMNLGLTHTDLKAYAKARHYLNLSLAEYGKQDQKHARAQVLNALGRLDMLTGDYRRAVPCALEAAALANKINARKELMFSYDLISEIYRHQNDLKNSYKYYKLFTETKDSIYTQQESNKIAEISAKIITLKKDNEINLLQKEKLIASLKIERNKYYYIFFTIGLMLMAIVIFLLIKYNRKIRTKEKMLHDVNINLKNLNQQLHEKIHEVRTLTGLLPICAQCKKIRNDKGYWEQLEGYISEHSQATFTHGICPNCAEDLYPEVARRERATRATQA